jgi:ribonuclease E
MIEPVSGLGGEPDWPRPPAPVPASTSGAEGVSSGPDPVGPGVADGVSPRKRRRRGSRGGRGRSPAAVADHDPPSGDRAEAADPDDAGPERSGPSADASDAGGDVGRDVPIIRPVAALDAPLVPSIPPPRPKVGDTRPAAPRSLASGGGAGGSGRLGAGPRVGSTTGDAGEGGVGASPKRRRRRGGRGRGAAERVERRPVEMPTRDLDEGVVLDAETVGRRRGRERKGRPVGRYLMAVHKGPQATQIAILEGRVLIEHYVSKVQDQANQIDGNIYVGRIQNVLPGMEAAFVDIGTPKNAVLYRGDVRFDTEDVEGGRPVDAARIEELLKPGQSIVCQVTKNPIAHKGARLTQEVSLPGRFVVFIPNSGTYGISKRLGDDERKRLRRILDEVRPANHGLIVRTAAEGATADELRRDVERLADQWERIDALARQARTPSLIYQEPDVAVRAIREEFNKDYRGVVIDDQVLYEDVRDYVASISPELADRVELFDLAAEPLPLFERHHVHEQLHKAIDRKVWLASGGSLIIERTEALTVIDVNTGKNVGSSNLEETVYRNNLEAADEIARQLRLRDIGGIIVIDFIDMEIAANRNEVVRAFREALARDKTRTQVFDISELGLVEMTRKRVSEGLVESLSDTCPMCAGRGIVFDDSLL